jgi:cytochrome c556
MNHRQIYKQISGAIVCTALVTFLVACAPADNKKQHQTAMPPFEPVLEMHDLMASVLDPATDVIWAAAGAEITAEGERDLSPVDDAGWQEVFDAAAIVTETGNLLMLPGRAEDNGDWMEYSAALITTGQEAMAAAKAQDAQAVFDVGGKLYLVCVACHQSYDLEEDMDEES